MKRNRYSSKKSNAKKFYTKENIFISRLASILNVSKKDVNRMFNERVVSAIRLNPLAGPVENIKSRVESKGFTLEPVSWSKDTYIIRDNDKSELSKITEYKSGLFYIQSLSSMLPVIALGSKPGERILDMCAAPGSKTSMIAALTGDKADLVANDQDFRRIGKLRNIIYQFHIKNIKVTQTPGESIGSRFSSHFDKVLLDAPCSGEGLIYLRSPRPLRFWSIKKVKAMSKLQKKLIESAYLCLKPGGTLVYSTCTLEPDENEAVLTHLIERHTEAKIEEISVVKGDSFEEYKQLVTPGIKHWSGNDYSEQVTKAVRVIPSSLMPAFFIAKIRKPE
ncbi:RsmB/NOP family class I SAM-dependent RNA methyltransferase [Candidatus Dojkabacteria bacterium]|uniref:RsmB/NOP family class I SAM-dependent RNA methyltransferase n=1 Tax=Candidatus Dojkabacteria bacterium TaxID=2099670 RepID=A0A955HX58_9BACT|nr:RsmB/NOP family class I SAM-dependent RNA methyltransferase [Candidatus Dojkabacteria bacterium]